MARIRTVKPSFWGSPDISRLSRDARLLILGLISAADDDGRFLAAPNAINGAVFPNDEITAAQIRKWLAEASERDEPIHLYEVDGVRYGCFPKWHKHQRISKYSPSILPRPDMECIPRGTRANSKDDDE